MAGKVILSRLEARVLVRNVLVQRFDEQVVDLLGQADLSHLQLGQVVGQHGVAKVRQHHLLENLHVLAGKQA